ncbi:MAG: penicillin acylase family protein [Bacteroidota bacterium]
MRLRRFLLGGLAVIVILALVLGVAGVFYFKSYLPDSVAPRSLPKTEGEIRLAGLSGPVDIYRDHMGIPHIYASSPHDLFFAEGYVHAQDRFWQMDTWRHIGSGTLSEMFGSAQVETDTFLRTLGWRVTAEAEWEQLSPDYRQILEDYSAGVNAYLKDHDGAALSLEYAVLGLLSPAYKIEPWTPVNSLTWGKAMAWDLRGNMDDEVERAVLLKTLTREQVDELFPPYPEDHPIIVNKIGDGGAAGLPPGVRAVMPQVPFEAVQKNVALLDGWLGGVRDGIGSNSWAVSGELTASGRPILANDPHLAIQMPSIWYQLDMHCEPKTDACPHEVGGFSFAGVPGVVIGHNDRVAWGFTNVEPDVMDLYIEKVNPENPDQYEVNGQWVDFEVRKETINVVGREPVDISVRLTRHGPVISDAYGPLKDVGDPKDRKFVPFRERAGIDLPEKYVVSLAWTALKPSTPFEAIWGFDNARNWEDFRAAAQSFHVPPQNLLYADVDGNIGYQTPGDFPIRRSGDGRFPVPGWTDDYEWTGYIPFDELPYTFNPAEGFIVSANNQIPPKDYPHLLSTNWDYGFRAARILEMITSAPGKIDIPYIQKMQGDDFDSNGPVFVPLIAALGDEDGLSAAVSLLKNWDFQARADSGGAAVFMAFTRALLRNTFNDDLPEAFWPEGGSRWNEVLRNIAKDQNSFWWDDKSTKDVVETRDDILKKSLSDGVAELEKTYGKDPSKWKWGDMHAATFRNQTLGKSGVGPIESLFNRGPFSVSGSSSIVNATGWNALKGYETATLPSMRMIVDLGDLTNSLTVHTTGESGHAFTRHYADMAPMWAGIQYYPMLWAQQDVIADAEGHLRLVP